MEEDKTKKSLRYSVYDGAAFAAMDGMTASFITPYAVALNASINLIASITYIPQLLGAMVQLFASRIVHIFNDRKKILIYCSFFHALLWIPLLLIPYLTPNQKYLLVAYIGIQTIFAEIVNPVWNSLMGDLVPKYERGRFFGFRNKVIGFTSFISAIAAGLILNHFQPRNPIIGFTILFSIAFVARILSSLFKFGMSNPPADNAHEAQFSLLDFVKRMDKTNYGHFVIYFVLLKFAVAIASPFFSVYMLKNLGFSYLQFTVLVSFELIASFVMLGIWGRLIDARGTKFVLYISGMIIPIIPVLWLISGNFYFLIFAEIVSGAVWSGFNLSSSNFIFDAVQPENRVRCISYLKFFEGISIFAGALLGGFLVTHLPALFVFSSILAVFIISAVIRLIAGIVMLPTLKEARLIEMPIGHTFFKKYLTIRPSEGIVFEVIGKYHRHEEQKHLELKVQKESKKPVPENDKNEYHKKLLKYIDKSISPKKRASDNDNMHEIEHITEEIEKGKLKKN